MAVVFLAFSIGANSFYLTSWNEHVRSGFAIFLVLSFVVSFLVAIAFVNEND